MNDLLKIPCVLMRGGTSRGPFFLASDLPRDQAEKDAALLSIMGSGHPLQIDGIGGGNPVTSKVAIVGPSQVEGADIDYLFAQVRTDRQYVDYSPNCGNMLAAVGPFAIEAGLVQAKGQHTLVRIHNVNTGKSIEAKVPTRGNEVVYLGDASIDGVPGLAAPIALTFVDAAGAKTGKLLPTGSPMDVIDDVEVTAIDCAMPMVLMRAADLGVTGYESPQDLTANRALIERMNRIRVKAGAMMGMGDVTDMVIPKPVLISPARKSGTLSVRYFMPNDCHPSLATTGAVGIATAAVTEGSIAFEQAGRPTVPAQIQIEHPAGRLDVQLEMRNGAITAGLLRTARRLFEGYAFAKPTAATEHAA
ncbi:MAG: 4-oxalomesaconate tautomerase [Alphaproteobacteria bacterium]|nr:4-oxalomesaconate tautomerase [Rhizobiaceae bacterium]MBU3960130.1 4-oxalomesaconate tautomerase [Alphaproteobacteria bacterium]MBU4051137.1 4-oxalomesaconate tautomerase [Alphaproteobacteria bacterium]MBU4090523.1 4-oxalomesaconate tautomerase [Alphaproteobacteria bacterium]MBU4155893.1 4-oxalomesaconate tautomerase [Alphaproteobacteria bacterium]